MSPTPTSRLSRRRWPALVAAVVLAAMILVTTGCGGPRVGVVDSQRILNESVLALSYQRELDDREKAMAADLQLLAGQLSPQELNARRQSHLQDLAALKRELEGRLNERIRTVVADVAQKRRLRVIFVKDGAPFGGMDITQDVIDRLK